MFPSCGFKLEGRALLVTRPSGGGSRWLFLQLLRYRVRRAARPFFIPVLKGVWDRDWSR